MNLRFILFTRDETLGRINLLQIIKSQDIISENLDNNNYFWRSDRIKPCLNFISLIVLAGSKVNLVKEKLEETIRWSFQLEDSTGVKTLAIFERYRGKRVNSGTFQVLEPQLFYPLFKNFN